MQNVDGIVIVDRSGIIRFVNPTAEILFDKKAEEMLSKPYGYPIVTGESTEFEVKHKNDVIVMTNKIIEMLNADSEVSTKRAIRLALLSHLFKRISAHLANISKSVITPIHK